MSLHNPAKVLLPVVLLMILFSSSSFFSKEINKSGSIGMTKEGQKLYFNDTRVPAFFLYRSWAYNIAIELL